MPQICILAKLPEFTFSEHLEAQERVSIFFAYINLKLGPALWKIFVMDNSLLLFNI